MKNKLMELEIQKRDISIKILENSIENLKCCGNCTYWQMGFCFIEEEEKIIDAKHYCNKWQYDDFTQDDRK